MTVNPTSETPIYVRDLGLINYKSAWDYQQYFFDEAVDAKLSNLRNKTEINIKNQFFFCEHPHVYTLGKSGSKDHLLLDHQQLSQKSIQFFNNNRGGDITYHGPGQIVGYPILDLEQFKPDIKVYMNNLEEVIIRTIAEYGLTGDRLKGSTGVWLDAEDKFKARKICAFGVKTSRWITMHGFALNVNTNLDYFNFIVPCGIVDKGITSLEKELGRNIDINEVKEKITTHFAVVFNAFMHSENKIL